MGRFFLVGLLLLSDKLKMLLVICLELIVNRVLQIINELNSIFGPERLDASSGIT